MFPIQCKKHEIEIHPLYYHFHLNLSIPRFDLDLTLDDITAIQLEAEGVFPQISAEEFAFSPHQVQVDLKLRAPQDLVEEALTYLDRVQQPEDLIWKPPSSPWPLHQLENWQLLHWEVVEIPE